MECSPVKIGGVADECKLEFISYEPEEVIDLLSESENLDNEDDESDCEIFGKMCTNLEDSLEYDQTGGWKKPKYVETLNNACSVETKGQIASGLGSFNEIINLDDSDNEPDCNANSALNNICESNAESLEEDVKEKKCTVLLDDDSDDSSQPLTIKNNGDQKNAHNLEAFLNYICPECGVSCGNIKKWNAHTDIVHNFRSISKLNLKTVISRQGQLLYECNTCEKKFISDVSYGILLNHRIQHMTIPNFLRCLLCEMRFSSRRLFLKHFKRHHKKIALKKLRSSDSIRCHIRFLCPICKKKAANLNEWKAHLEIEHDYCNKFDEKVYTIRDNLVECHTCQAIFRSSYILWHLVRHEEHNPFHCKLCKTVSSYNLSKITNHIRKEHLREKCKREFRCNYCDKIFQTNVRRFSHMNEMHTIEKLNCEICDKEFNSSARLLAHMAKLNHQKIK